MGGANSPDNNPVPVEVCCAQLAATANAELEERTMARTGFGRKIANGSSNGLTEAKPGPQAAPRAAAETRPPLGTVREVKPSLDQVRAKAFELYQARAKAGRPGDAASDWLEAEKQLTGSRPHSAR